MCLNLNVNDLMEYTDWEREKWHEWLRRQIPQVLKISTGPHGDGRFETVGDLVRHVFAAEKRYVEKLSGRPLTETASIPNDNIEALFQFGQQSREGLREFVKNLPAQGWDVPQDLKFPNLNVSARATPKKIVVHILLHEVRHWAQIATLLRLNGLTRSEFHDFLFSPIMGEFRREQPKG